MFLVLMGVAEGRHVFPQTTAFLTVNEMQYNMDVELPPIFGRAGQGSGGMETKKIYIYIPFPCSHIQYI